MTFGLRLIVAFFACDAIEKLVWAARLAVAEGVPVLSGRHFGEHYLPLVLVIVFDVLLVVQLLLGTRAGRFWAIVFLGANAILALYVYVVEPGRWVALGGTGRRALEMATVFLNVAMIGYLVAGKASRERLIR